ncbi:phage tail tape measure protein [Streptomonospora litoralis]|uniref:Phage-related minor tail protein n=1 Tax=Streptomonospora litoralis TaxID=2498135 RepID=A0A4P6Q7S4_9ACTN|nr:phage tail tape measure protein [Streptomonospora litoralis]QBI56795.1 Phage-related minor tail protein [Streptomonospora litoralis]
MSTLEELTVVLDADVKAFDRDMRRLTRQTRRTLHQVEQSATRAGRSSGGGFTAAFEKETTRGVEQTTERSARRIRDSKGRFIKAGTATGSSFVSGMDEAVSSGVAQTMRTTAAQAMGDTSQAFSRGGDLAARGWVRGADGRIRDSRGRFINSGELAAAGIGQGLGSGTQQATAPLGGLGRAGGASFTGGMTMGLAGLAGAFGGLPMLAGTAAAAMGASVLTASKDFEAAMNNVKAISGATGQEFQAMSDLARELGSTTMFSATEAANALGFLSQAGLSAHESMEALPGTLDLAAASGMELARAADISTNILSGMGLEVSQLGRLNDVLASTASNANTNVEELGYGFKYVGPIASSAGMSLEETAAVMGTFANAGIKGENAGTALRGALSYLIRPTAKVQETLDALGVTVTKANGDLRPMADIMRDLEAAGAGTADMMNLFGVESGPAMIALLRQGGDELDSFTGKLRDSEGAAKRMADIKMSGLQGALKGATSAMEGLFLAIGDMGVLDGATALVDMFSGAVRGVTGFLEEHEAAIKPVLEVVGMLAGAITVVVAALLAGKAIIAGVTAALGVVLSPIGLIIGALAALAAALALAWKRSETFREIVTGVWEKVGDAAGAVADWFRSDLWPVLVDGWRELRDATEPHIERIVGWLNELRKGAEAFEGRWSWVWEQAADKIELAKDFAADWGGAIIRQLRGAIDLVTGLIEGDWSKAWDGAKEAAKGGADYLVALFSTAGKLIWQALKLWFWQLPGSVSSWLADAAPEIADALATEWIPAFLEWYGDLLDQWHTKLGELRDDLIGWIRGVPSDIKDNLPTWTVAFTDWAGGLSETVRTKLSGVGRSLGGWFVDEAAKMPGRLASWTQKLGDWAGGLWEKTKAKFDSWGWKLTYWVEDFAADLPAKLDSWTRKITTWIQGFADTLPIRLQSWTDKFVAWIEGFAEGLPEKLTKLTKKFVDWATGVPDKTVKGLKEEDAPGKLATHVEEDWGPRLIGALGTVLFELAKAVPGMVAQVGLALLRAYGKAMGALAQSAVEAGRQLLNIVRTMFIAIVQVVIGQLTEMVTVVGEKFGEMKDKALDKARGLYDELVGNSIIPDMVSEIIGETKKLPSGVGDQVTGMNTKAIEQTRLMAAAMTTQVAVLRSSVLLTLVALRKGSTALVRALAATILGSIGQLVTQSLRLAAVLARGFTGAFDDMAADSTKSFFAMVRALQSGSRSLVSMLLDATTHMRKGVLQNFRATVVGVHASWGRLRQAAAAPVRYVIDPVVNKGLRGVWNTIARKVPGLSTMGKVPGFDQGGMVDLTGGGKLAGYSSKDNRLAAVRDGEGVLTPQATTSLGGRSFIDSANRLGGDAGKLLLEGFASGGVVGLANRFRELGKDSWDNRGGVVAAGNRALNGMAAATANRYGTGNDLHGQGFHDVRHWNRAISAQIKAHREDLEIGKGAKAVVELAQRTVGRFPENPPGSNRNAITDWYGMAGSPWCAMYVSWLFDKTKNSSALKGASRTAWTGDYYTSGMRRVSESQKKPGDVAVYGTSHVNTVNDPERYRIGGNEGNNVRRSTRSGGAIFRPDWPGYAMGGLIDPADFVMQDKGWEGQPADHIAALRQILPSATYDTGGYLPVGYSLAYNGTGAPEPVGAEPIRIVIDLEGGDAELRRRIRKITRIEGGGNVQIAFGKGANA